MEQKYKLGLVGPRILDPGPSCCHFVAVFRLLSFGRHVGNRRGKHRLNPLKANLNGRREPTQSLFLSHTRTQAHLIGAKPLPGLFRT